VTKLDISDYFIMAALTAVFIVSTTFIFLHPDAVNFATWGTIATAGFGVFHLLRIRDDKRPDA
jgi:hypothetical protein